MFTRGEVHALLGENGAGKSTAYEGPLWVLPRGFRGGPARREDRSRFVLPHDARNLRIGMVFQDFVQVRPLTVAENIALFLPDLPAVLDQEAILQRIEEISHRYGLAWTLGPRSGNYRWESDRR